MNQFKRHLIGTFILSIPIIILHIKIPTMVSGDYGDITAAGRLVAQAARVSTIVANASIGFQGGSTITQNNITSPLVINSTTMIGGFGMASFSMQNGSMSVLGNSTATFNFSTVTFRGNPGQGSTVTVGALQFQNMLIGGQQYIQNYPAYQLLNSTMPNAAISTITLFVPSSSWTYIVFSGSNNAGPNGGDLFVYFNGILKDSLYSVMRTTIGAGLNTLAVSSLQAVGITVFGDNVSSDTSRNFRLDYAGNSTGEFKDGKIFAVAHTTATEAPVRSEVGYAWYASNQVVTSISVTFLKSGNMGAGASVFKVGSFMAVYGNMFKRND